MRAAATIRIFPQGGSLEPGADGLIDTREFVTFAEILKTRR
jgi:hypothetical protein